MTIRTIAALGLILLGTLVIAISILGLFRFRDALERIHAGAVTDTLGVLLILGGLILLCGWNGGGPLGHQSHFFPPDCQNGTDYRPGYRTRSADRRGGAGIVIVLEIILLLFLEFCAVAAVMTKRLMA